jgi:hypothetical protein
VTHLVLYSRPECHLCEELLEQLRPMLEPADEVRIVDISGDIGLERRYSLRIPVLTTEDGLELSSYPFDRDRVANYLAESR